MSSMEVPIKTTIIGILTGFIIHGAVREAQACSSVFLNQKGAKIIGRTLDWPTKEGFVVANERDVSRKAVMLQDGSKPVEWKSIYGSVTFNMVLLATENQKMSGPDGGMNEKGLWFGALWVSGPPGVKYPVKDDRLSINNWQVGQYILDTCKNVDEAVAVFEKLRISGFKSPELSVNLHWFFADSSGKTGIVEFPDGKLVKYVPAEPPVMTNSFRQASLDYLKPFTGFGGEKIIEPGKLERISENRFLLACSERNNIPAGRKPGIKDAIKVIGVAAQTSSNKNHASNSVTQWTEGYDLEALALEWNTPGHPGMKKLDLKKIDFKFTGKTRAIDIDTDKAGKQKI